MATVPTPEDAARHILTVFQAKGCRPGEAIRMNHLIMAFTGDWRAADRDAGLAFALEQAWITEGPNGGIVLTDAGFAEI